VGGRDESEIMLDVKAAVCTALTRTGWTVLRMPSPSGKILPDAIAHKDGKPSWFVLLPKTACTTHRKTGLVETGMALRLFQAYEKLCVVSALPVHLYFIHSVENEIRELCLIDGAYFKRRIWPADTMDKGGTIFFPWDSLTPVMSLDSLQASAHR
jgi:hypothetical protein